MIALLLALACQEPDRSTPGKAFLAFLDFWDRERVAEADWEAALRAKAAVMKDHATEAFRTKLDEDVAGEMLLAAASKGRDVRYELTKVRAEGDAATVEGLKRGKDWRKDEDTQQAVEVEVALPIRARLAKKDGVWRVREYDHPCYVCSGSGACSFCKGTGKNKDSRNCEICDGGKSCGICKGEKVSPENLTDFRHPLVLLEPEPKFSTARSTAKEAAQTAADLAFRQEIVFSKETLKIWRGVVARYRLLVVEEHAKVVAEGLEKDVEEGRRRGRDERPVVESLEEKGDAAAVTVAKTVLDGGKKRVEKRRFHLRKSGETWLIDAEAKPCWSCRGSAVCGSCTPEDKECYGCSGKKKCGMCEGRGFEAP